MADESSSSYIRMVQHLIEKCLQFNMTKEECVEAIEKYANIKPIITTTVWKELEKENKEFFEAYAKKREESVVIEMETHQRIQNLLSELSASRNSDDQD